MNTFKQLMKIYLRKEKWFIFGIMLIFIQLSLSFVYHKSIFSHPSYPQTFPNAGLEFFYYFHAIGLHPYLFICLLLLLPNLLSADFLNHQHIHLHYLIEQRIGKKKYYWYSFLQNMLITFVATMIIEIMIAFTIHCFYLRIAFQTMTYPQHYYITAQLLCRQELYNMIAFIFITAIGYSLVSALFFTFQKVISNVYVYRCCGVMIGIMLVLFPALIQGYLPYPDLAFVFQINNLVCLGIEGLREIPFGWSPFVLYCVTATIYAVVSGLFAQALFYWRAKYD